MELRAQKLRTFAIQTCRPKFRLQHPHDKLSNPYTLIIFRGAQRQEYCCSLLEAMLSCGRKCVTVGADVQASSQTLLGVTVS